MPNITDDLRRRRELGPVYLEYLMGLFGPLDDLSEATAPGPDDPQIIEYKEIDERLGRLALEGAAVVIEDRELHQDFEKFRRVQAKYSFDDAGWIRDDDLYDRILSECNPHDFARRLTEAKPLVTLINVPQEVIQLVAEARRAYCLRLPTACISVCRSAIECTVVDIAVRIGRLPAGEDPHELRMCAKISALIDADLTSQSPIRRDIDQLMRESSAVIHNAVKPDEADALRIFMKTLEIAKMLYGYYAAQLKKRENSALE